jgi:hypothetical protein
MPAMTYGFPFWHPNTTVLRAMTSICVAPLRRALHLPRTVATLATMLECGVLTSEAVLHRATLSYCRRVSLLPPGHTTAAVWATQPDYTPLKKQLQLSEAALQLHHGNPATTPSAIRAAAVALTVRRYQESKWVRDLPVLYRVLPLPATAQDSCAYYIRRDRWAYLRARLRLNRSSTADSQLRRRVDGVATAACAVCSAPNDTPAHLLQCPAYASAAHAFLRHPYVDGEASLLLRDPARGASRRRSAFVLKLGTTFLLHVKRRRPTGL